MLRVGPREGVGGAAASAALSALPLQMLTAKQHWRLFSLCLLFIREKIFFGFLSLTKPGTNVGLS